MAEILIWTLALWTVFLVVGAYFRESLGRRWKPVALGSLVPAVLIAVVLVFVSPPFGGYDPMAARFWISRAAAEPDSAAKEALVRRVALASPEYGWFTASQAIGSIESGAQRCRLRTILAGVAGIRNRERLGNEARDECNASLLKGNS